MAGGCGLRCGEETFGGVLGILRESLRDGILPGGLPSLLRVNRAAADRLGGCVLVELKREPFALFRVNKARALQEEL
jgi:hypothetical protein